jgi:hypothetical protein
MMKQRALRLGVSAIAAMVLGACSSLVGATCADGYTRCGRMCVDVSSDAFNCGTCGNQCGLGIVCVASSCMSTRDAAIDSGHDGGPHDAGVDAAPVDAEIDSSRPDASRDAAPREDGAVTGCALGELRCDDTCVDPSSDSAHCGHCTNACDPGEVCAGGTCSPSCDPLTECDGVCADLTTDPDHCGDCDTDCGSGICAASACEPEVTGHLVIIGHDYERRRTAMSSVLANAVLLSGRSPVRVVGWAAQTTAFALAGTNGAIEDGRGARTYTMSLADSAEEVPVLLATADTFLVYAQEDATVEELDALGALWAEALVEFLARGGVVVLLDGPSTENSGTYQILQSAGLFTATASTELLTPRLDTVLGRDADPVLVGVPLSYRGEQHTVFYSTLDPDAVVSAVEGPVVIDRTFTR